MSDASTTSNKSAPLKTSAFKIPGEGPSALISIATVTAILVLWFASTNLGWIKPLFLPSPQATFQQFYEYLSEYVPCFYSIFLGLLDCHSSWNRDGHVADMEGDF